MRYGMTAAGRIIAVWWVCGLLVGSGCGREDPRWSEARRDRSREQQHDELERLRLAVRQERDSPEVRLRLANACLERNHLQEASTEFKRVLAQDPQNLDALLGLSTVAVRLDDEISALALLGRAAQLKSEDPFILNNLALLWLQLGRLKKATQTFQQALEIRPEDPMILLNAARCWARRGNIKAAQACCLQAVRADPEALAPRLMLAELKLRRGLVPQALEEFQSLTQAYPDSAEAYEALGRGYRSQNRQAEALEAFTQAQRLRPDWLKPRLQAGEVCLRLEAYDKAESFFARAVQRFPNSVEAQLGLAEALKSRRKWDQAIEVYEKTLADHPGHPTVLNNLAYLYAQQDRHLPRALRIARRAVEAYPHNGSIWDTMGWVCYRKSRYKEALGYLRKAVELAPNNGTIYYHLGKTLLATGRRDEAAQAFRKALSYRLPQDEKEDAEGSLAWLSNRSG